MTEADRSRADERGAIGGTPTVLEALEEAFVAMRATALAEVERLAREVLADRPPLDEFVMAMGSATFALADSDERISPQDPEDAEEFTYLGPLHRLLVEWDETLGLTGTPMRFTATGPKITEWGARRGNY